MRVSSIKDATRPVFLLYVLFSLVAISFLPTLVPSEQTASDSYLFGYNNRAGIILLLCLVAIGVIWTKGLNLQFLQSRRSSHVPVGTLAFSLVAVVCGCTIMYVFAGRYGGFGESYYVIDRVWLLAEGKVPYRDFEFAYGPAMLYGPMILHSLFAAGIAKAYYLFWAASYLLGTVLLFKTVNMVDYPSAAKQDIFLLLFLSGLFPIIRMGTNYSFLRFVCPLFFVLLVQKWFRDPTDRWSVRAVAVSMAFTAILLSLSAETAIAFAFACIWICAFSRIKPILKRVATATALLAVFLGLFWTAKELHVLDTLLADGSGAISFPIMMAPHILLFIAANFVCGCYLYRRLRDRQINDNTVGLIGYSVPMLAAALGRCDPSHVFWNGLAMFLASMFYLSIYRKTWSIYTIAFLLFVFLFPTMSEFYLFVPQLRAVKYLNEHGGDDAKSSDLATLYPMWTGQFLAPFGYRPNGFGTYRSDRVDYGRFEDVIDVSTRPTVDAKEAEMRNHPERALIVPDNYEFSCRIDPRKERHYLTVLLLYPYFGREVHPVNLRHGICDYIEKEYQLAQESSPRNFGYALWVPRTQKR